MDLHIPNNNHNKHDDKNNTTTIERDKHYQSLRHSSLDNADKILQDLDRKLSISSNTSSQQTNTSSVIQNNQFKGLGKQNIQINILDKLQKIDQQNTKQDLNQNLKNDIIYDNIFNPTEIFNEISMENFKTTTFNQQYNDDKLGLENNQSKTKSPSRKDFTKSDSLTDNNGKIIRKNSLNLAQNRLERSGHEDSTKKIKVKLESEQEDDEDDVPHRLEILDDLQNYNSDDEIEDDKFHNGEEEQNDNINSEDDELTMEDDSLMMTLSPPRSPPSELDPDKLYGLYDFSGPDPSHCSLTRNEPVHLINDEDNYWWLIKKLTKIERIARENEGDLSKDIDDLSSDEEDGKIGFVPAECLETHGERLARLNCYKNEEIEKSTEGDLTIVNTSKSNISLKASKSVTFVNLLQNEESENEEEDEEENNEVISAEKIIKEEVPIHNDNENIYSMMNDQEIRINLAQYNIEAPDLYPPQHQDKETLSDVYPAETPLIITKKNSIKNSPSTTTNTTTTASPSNSKLTTPILQQTNKFNESLYPQPRKFGNYDNLDDVSISSFSPDTPLELKSPRFNSNSEINKSPNLRRSIILDRLTKVTSDIEEQMNSHNSDDEERTSNGSKEQIEQIGVKIKKPLQEDESEDDDEEFSFDSYAQDHSIEIARNDNDKDSLDNMVDEGNSSISLEEIDKDSFINNIKSNEELKNYNHQVSNEGSKQITNSSLINQSRNSSTTSINRNNSLTTRTHQLYRSSTSSLNVISSAEKLRTPPSNHQNHSTSTPIININNSNPLSYNKTNQKSLTSVIDEVEILSDIDNDLSNQNFEENNITPLTSMNSLTPQQNNSTTSNNNINDTNIIQTNLSPERYTEKEKTTSNKEKRKSKPVHDMFMPILGKFDELAEKLAELDDILK
ncbi:BUD14 [Candida jiufengensis]|uniref:BUD14 n=1 Tax=Candida jiufengensis TaxID=497108 RepID=UPI002224787B|nr:BUD14 [Candida jiufengensis]KAI5951419.1 BUD14 [Candida jiufengensis]